MLHHRHRHFLKKFGLCILRIPNIISARGVWFTFIYRKQEHLAVGSSGTGLTDSRGSHLLALPALTFCILIIAQSVLFVKHFFSKVGNQLWVTFQLPVLQPFGSRLALADYLFLLCPYCITTWEVCQGDFATFAPYCYIFFWRLCRPIGYPPGSCYPLPLTPLLYHTLRGLSRGIFKLL